MADNRVNIGAAEASGVAKTKHIVMFSGGVGSWCAAKRVAERNGAENVTLLFTDTLIEDPDLYRFIGEAAANVGAPLLRIAEGRDPWQLFFDHRMMGGSRVDLCSRILKREAADKWLLANCDPANTVIYLGIDWTESHRFDSGEGRGAKHRYARNGWACEAPMTEKPFLDKKQMLEWLDAEGIARPSLYGHGFAHNNCGGFCVKAGIGHFARLLQTLPERYRHHEAMEAAFQAHVGKPNAILRDRSGGTTTPLSLAELRKRLEQGHQPDMFDIGGCGCFSEAVDEAA